MKILTLNAGSNSLKFKIVAESGSTEEFGYSLVSGVYDNIGKNGSIFKLLDGKRPTHKEEIEIRDHGHATELLLDWINHGNTKDRGIDGLRDVERIGHRVVHGADRFSGPTKITDGVIRQIEDLSDLAPLHNESALAVIRAAQSKIGSRIPMIAVFDTVFHQSIPDEAALYPLPVDLAKQHKIRRYGFHGISHKYLTHRYAQIESCPVHDVNIITLHLEGGSSAAAIRNGCSVDTSMGFTPLEGLMMGTRCGDIDPAIVTYLMRKEKLETADAENLLNKQCGLIGISGSSADTRELIKHLDDERALLALKMFSYRVRKYIGAYLAALGGAEAIVFGGGIAENTPLVREWICEGLAWFGAILDRARNNQTIDREGAITIPDARVPVWVIPTQEGLMMAREVASWGG